MKKYYVLLSLNKKKRKLDELVMKKGLTDKKVVKLCKKIDKLLNMYE